MRPILLILGGSSEASALARRAADLGIDATLSYAGRVVRPIEQPIPTRSGGFGGVEGLAQYLRETGTTHLVDATHPFAGGMSRNAIAAAGLAKVPLLALTRPPWTPEPGDSWHHVSNMQSAAKAIGVERKNVFLGIGRQEISPFTSAPHHRYVLRVIDPPDPLPSLPDYTIIEDRGPFTFDADRDLLRTHKIDTVVSKNSGGSAARAKIDAARDLGLQVIMVDRPETPARQETHSLDDVIRWLDHSGTDLGV